MTYDDARQALRSAVYAAWVAEHSDVPIVFDNDRTFDWSNPPQRFVCFEVEFSGGDQIALGLQPRTRTFGHVYVCVKIKAGLGVREADQWLDWFKQKVEYLSVGRLQVRVAEPDGSDDGRKSGWYAQHLKFAFWVDPN